MKTIYPFSILSLAGLAIGCNSPVQQNNKPVNKPNIIYILADDMGVGDLGCYGQQLIKTPNIDKLASEGIRFTRHYCGTSVSAPSRCVLMTGMHSGHTEVRGNMEIEPHGQKPLSDSTLTVAEVLKQAGYCTALIGKWGLGSEGTSGDPNKQGFDLSYGYLDQVLAHNSFPEYLLRNGKKEMLNNEVKWMDSSHWSKGYGSYSTKKVEFSNDLFSKEAEKYIIEKKDTNFFLYLPYTTPHDNGEALEGEKIEVPSLTPYENENWTKEEKAYAASITRLDAQIGKIVSLIDSLGIGENTIIVFSSDNGAENSFIFNSNASFKGGKRDLYEGGIRAPFIVRWKGRITENQITDHISAFQDFLPTACDIACIDIPKNIDGISFLPTLFNQPQKKHAYLYWEFHEQGGKQAILVNNWKGIRNNVAKNPNSVVELYDLSKDKMETTNIVKQNPEMVDELMKILKRTRTVSNDFNFGK